MPPERVIAVVVCGATGRMGRLVIERIGAAASMRLAGCIGRRSLSHEAAQLHGCDRVERPSTALSVLDRADVLVDFSSPEALDELLRAHGRDLAGKAIVTGTTGLTDDVVALLDRCAETSPVLAASNFSVGVNLLAGLVEKAAAVLDAASYDIEIVETHHAGKVDAPSGTALTLGEAVARARGVELAAARRDGRSGRTGERATGEIGFHALRGGGVTGEHRVLFLGRGERLELTHEAFDRSLFADGALEAVRWIVGRPAGRYSMAQVLGVNG